MDNTLAHGCHLGVNWVSIGCHLGVTWVSFGWLLRAYLCPVGSIYGNFFRDQLNHFYHDHPYHHNDQHQCHRSWQSCGAFCTRTRSCKVFNWIDSNWGDDWMNDHLGLIGLPSGPNIKIYSWIWVIRFNSKFPFIPNFRRWHNSKHTNIFRVRLPTTIQLSKTKFLVWISYWAEVALDGGDDSCPFTISGLDL